MALEAATQLQAPGPNSHHLDEMKEKKRFCLHEIKTTFNIVGLLDSLTTAPIDTFLSNKNLIKFLHFCWKHRTIGDLQIRRKGYLRHFQIFRHICVVFCQTFNSEFIG